MEEAREDEGENKNDKGGKKKSVREYQREDKGKKRKDNVFVFVCGEVELEGKEIRRRGEVK